MHVRLRPTETGQKIEEDEKISKIKSPAVGSDFSRFAKSRSCKDADSSAL
jgi:hypothetical protein